jgi:hypothetical protein
VRDSLGQDLNLGGLDSISETGDLPLVVLGVPRGLRLPTWDVTTVAWSEPSEYGMDVAKRRNWVFLAYRLPREPSTPRISVWRKLKALGVVQLLDGLAALPLSSRNREQLEWLAEDVTEAGGEASIWIAQSATATQERALVERMAKAVGEEYRELTVMAEDAAAGEPQGRPRALRRLRRHLHRIRQRDYFPPPDKVAAAEAIDRLAELAEARS